MILILITNKLRSWHKLRSKTSRWKGKYYQLFKNNKVKSKRGKSIFEIKYFKSKYTSYISFLDTMKKRLKTERPDLSRNRKLFHLFLEINSNETFDIYQRIMLSPTVKIKTKKKRKLTKKNSTFPAWKKKNQKPKKPQKQLILLMTEMKFYINITPRQETQNNSNNNKKKRKNKKEQKIQNC